MKIVLFLLVKILNIDFVMRFINRKRITIISYHNPAPSIFCEHMKYFKKYYNIISMDDFLEGKNILENSLIITFDDGHKDNVRLLNSFIEYQIKPTIYMCSQVVATNHAFWWKTLHGKQSASYKQCSNEERLSRLKKEGLYTPEQNYSNPDGLTMDDIQVLKPYVIFGSHTCTHPILTQCKNEEQKKEILNSKTELEVLCGVQIKHFAYPNGNYNDYSIKCIQAAGYATARTTDVGWNNIGTNMYTLKVIGISDNANLTKLRFQMSGLSMWIQYLLKGSLVGKKTCP